MKHFNNKTASGTQSAFFKCVLKENHILCIQCTGSWSLYRTSPSLEALHIALLTHAAYVQTLTFEVADTMEWDSSFILFLTQCQGIAQIHHVCVMLPTLPEAAQKWIHLYQSNTSNTVETLKEYTPNQLSWLEEVTQSFRQGYVDVTALIQFIRALYRSIGLLFKAHIHFRWKECVFFMYQVGAQALPIVCLISLLVGLIMAFVGSLQLAQFGATIYIANLVGLAIVREMGAMMTGVILAGRTGAAFAASLASMKLSEEVDALKTLGINPVIFLVLPRILATCVMTPLLCVFSNFMGMLGGLIIGVTTLQLTWPQYVSQTQKAVGLTDFFVGIIKSFVFGFLIALVGCLKGLKTGNTTEAVGAASTSAVVWGITAIIIADALFAILFNFFNI